MREFKDATSGVQREIEDSMKDVAPKKTVSKPTANKDAKPRDN
jgi:Sec-independent protein translocase protein TatA